MEHIVEEPLFVEFYGLPGCGKSTVSHLVATRLRDKGYIVDEPSYIIDRNYRPFFRKLKKLYIYLSWLIFHNNTFQRVNVIVSRNGYSGVVKIEQISNVLQKISAYRASGQNRIVIWDQGLVQASISLSLKGEINAEENLKSLLHILESNVEIKYVMITLDEQIALERMSKRPTNDSRAEKIKDAKQKHQMMSRFQHEIDVIKKVYAGIAVDGMLVVEKQVSQISGALLSAIRN